MKKIHVALSPPEEMMLVLVVLLHRRMPLIPKQRHYATVRFVGDLCIAVSEIQHTFQADESLPYAMELASVFSTPRRRETILEHLVARKLVGKFDSLSPGKVEKAEFSMFHPTTKGLDSASPLITAAPGEIIEGANEAIPKLVARYQRFSKHIWRESRSPTLKYRRGKV